MRVAWAVAALLITVGFAIWMMTTPEMWSEAPRSMARSQMTLGDVVADLVPHALAAIGIPLLLAYAARGRRWRTVSGLGLAVRASVAVGAIAMLVWFGAKWWAMTDPAGASTLWLSDLFLAPLWSLAGGALFLESLRRRRARLDRVEAAPVVPEGILLVMVAFAGIGMLMAMWRYS